MDEEDFIRAILASPDDDTLRLVFADWLEDQGSPRGEFIRLHCELANTEDTDRRVQLRRRLSTLQNLHPQQIIGPKCDPGMNWVFYRGLLNAFEPPGLFVLPYDDSYLRFFANGQVTQVRRHEFESPGEWMQCREYVRDVRLRTLIDSASSLPAEVMDFWYFHLSELTGLGYYTLKRIRDEIRIVWSLVTRDGWATHEAIVASRGLLLSAKEDRVLTLRRFSASPTFRTPITGRHIQHLSLSTGASELLRAALRSRDGLIQH